MTQPADLNLPERLAQKPLGAAGRMSRILPQRCSTGIANEEYSLLFIDLNYWRDTTSGQEGSVENYFA
jgi:hypothetical protein